MRTCSALGPRVGHGVHRKHSSTKQAQRNKKAWVGERVKKQKKRAASYTNPSGSNKSALLVFTATSQICGLGEQGVEEMGSGSGSFLKVVVKNLDVLAGPIVSLAYPLYASVRAIETKSAVDDQQWLTYWVLYSFITLFELTFAPIIEWLPFWSYAKLFFNCWLVLPYFNGAAHVYEHFVRPMIVNQQVVNIWYNPRKDDSSRPDDVISAAQRYIEQNGSKAFENIVNKFRTSNARRSILEEVEAERRAKAERESEARDENPFYDQNYRY